MGKTGIVQEVVTIKGCKHAGLASAHWDYGPGEAPCLVYRGFPMAGAIVLSQKTVIVSCKACLDHLDDILKEVSKTNLQ